MPKKQPVKLPQVSGASPRSIDGGRLDAGSVASSPRRVLWDPATAPKGGANGSFEGEPSGVASTFLPTSISTQDAQSLSEVLDGQFSIPAGFSAASHRGGGDDWEVQSPEDIIREVRRCVQERQPWREEFDDATLDRRLQTERQERLDRGYHIILPDNRVRAIEDQLSRRVRAQLLDEEETPEPQPTAPSNQRRQQEKRVKADPRKVRAGKNPWYLPAESWYNKDSKDMGESRGGGFPYDSQILRSDGRPGTADEQESANGDGGIRALTRREKETLQIVDAYRTYMRDTMKGARLPHFLHELGVPEAHSKSHGHDHG